MECSFLEDEKFDFDLPLSPEEERNDEGDDDEIFFGPIGYNERCIATNTETKATKIHDDIEKTKPVSRTAKKSSILTPKRISDAESFQWPHMVDSRPLVSALVAEDVQAPTLHSHLLQVHHLYLASTSNEAFTVSKGSEQPKTSNTKQPSSQKSRPSARGMLTKAFTSKPVFAKPHEVSKTSKLQPIKAVQTAAGSSKRLSSAGLRSPAPKTNTRPASAGGTCTPLRTPTPKADRTPVKGQTPIRRRISNASSITMKTRQNDLVTSSEVSEKAVTRQARRSITGIPGVGGAKTNAVSGAMTRRPASAMKATFKSQFEKHRTPQPSTPEKKLEKAKNGPDKT
ncbi:hypothetical protein QZH41_009330, partial [Actinostola sp. cb2023]